MERELALRLRTDDQPGRSDAQRIGQFGQPSGRPFRPFGRLRPLDVHHERSAYAVRYADREVEHAIVATSTGMSEQEHERRPR